MSSNLDTLCGFVRTAGSVCSNPTKCPGDRAAPILYRIINLNLFLWQMVVLVYLGFVWVFFPKKICSLFMIMQGNVISTCPRNHFSIVKFLRSQWTLTQEAFIHISLSSLNQILNPVVIIKWLKQEEKSNVWSVDEPQVLLSQYWHLASILSSI